MERAASSIAPTAGLPALRPPSRVATQQPLLALSVHLQARPSWAWQLQRHVYRPDPDRNTYQGRAELLNRLKRFSEAAADWGQVVQLLGNAAPDDARLRHAYMLVQAGDGDKGLAALEKVIASPTLPAPLLYDAACAFAIAAGAKHQGNAAEPRAVKAIELLQRAQATGFFQPPPRLAWLKQDPDLDSLRNRDDFRKWLAQLEGK
jgi:tetratricopeptide (TPR) repeat protein